MRTPAALAALAASARRDAAGVVDAIGQQHQHARLLRQRRQALDRHRDRIADRRFGAGQPHRRALQLRA